MKILKQPALFIGLSLFTLSGCSLYQESFDCPVGEGVRCASLSTINNKMDKGQINTDEPVAGQSTEPASTVYLSPQFRDQLQAR
jgi:Type IV conjugative transfer system lipoprotein (TraV).